MDRGPVDLSPLDPFRDGERFDRLVQRIMDRAASELDRRAARDASIAAVLAGWARPALAAAAVIAVLATASVGALDPLGPSAQTADVDAVADAFDLPAPLAGWLADDGPPSVSALIAAAEGGQIP